MTRLASETPAEHDEVAAQLALIRHFAQIIAERNYNDVRLYLLQHIQRLDEAIAKRLVPAVAAEPSGKLDGIDDDIGSDPGQKWQGEHRAALPPSASERERR